MIVNLFKRFKLKLHHNTGISYTSNALHFITDKNVIDIHNRYIGFKDIDLVLLRSSNKLLKFREKYFPSKQIKLSIFTYY